MKNLSRENKIRTGNAFLAVIFLFTGIHLANSQVLMPVEVIGAPGKVESRTFNLTQQQIDNASSIFFYANNLSYENKGSLRINNGSWISLNHSDVTIFAKEMAYGGMVHGGFNSIRFTVPKTGLKAGSNIIEFRFDLSDGISSGFRIFRMNLLDAAGNEILPASFFQEDDPKLWNAPAGFEDAGSIAAGKDLWENASLWNHNLPNGQKSTWYGNELQGAVAIKATCANCHTQDGRDLEYFSYSNESIVERAKFHQLSESDGKKIASYIRSLDVPRHGRPWNPPYQPGPEIDNRPVEQWAAGAGIDAVLEKDEDMLPYLFPNGTSQQDVYDYFDSDKMYDQTIVPVAVQFPDWKHWLPIVHPKDAYGAHWDNAPDEFDPKLRYAELRAFMESNASNLPGVKQQFFDHLFRFFWSFRGFHTVGSNSPGFFHWRSWNSTADNYVPVKTLAYKQLARTSLARMMAVKNFEIHQEFNLEDKADQFIDPVDQPNVRQWLAKPTDGYNVFEVPPHFTSCIEEGMDCQNFLGQPMVTGRYESTNWYELQLILNPGSGQNGVNSPVDYSYVPTFILSTSKSSGIEEPLRYYRAVNSMYQTKSWSRDNDPQKKTGFRIRQQGPWVFYGVNDAWVSEGYSIGYWPRTLDNVEQGLKVKVMNAVLKQLSEQLNRPVNHPKTYRRKAPPLEFELDPIEKSSYSAPAPGVFAWADRFYYLIPKFERMGCDKQILGDIVNWCKTAWPNMNWKFIWPDLIMGGNETYSQSAVVYPNPANKAVIIAGNESGTFDVEIWNMTGSKMFSTDQVKEKCRVDVSNWAPGIYLLKMKFPGGQIINKKVVVQ